MSKTPALPCLIAWGLLALPCPAADGPIALVSTRFIDDDPASPSCHASTVVEARRRVLAAWFAGSEEGKPDVEIQLARFESGRWTRPTRVLDGVQDDGRRFPCWNPVLSCPRVGPILLFAKVGPSPSRWWGVLTTSDDDGLTWSRPRKLPEGILGPIKNKPIELADGSLLCPSSHEDPKLGWRVFLERTPDLGRTWTKVGPLNDGIVLGAIQPSLLTHPGGRLQVLCRSRQGRIAESWSDDQGRTWSPMTLTDLPNPNSGTDALTLLDGRQLLVSNPSTKDRTPLTVSLSADGKAWQTALTLEDQPGEYSYPAAIQSSDGLVQVTYTWNRTRIKHAVLDPGGGPK